MSPTAALAPGKYEITMEKLILAFGWAADETGISQEAADDAAWQIMRAWVAVQECGGWPTSPATRDLPPPRPRLTVVHDPEPASDRALLEELQGNVRSLVASLAPEPTSATVTELSLRPKKTDAELVGLYSQYQGRRNLAKTTIEVRNRFFRQFIREHRRGLQGATKESIEQWLDGRKPKHRRWCTTTLRCFYAWAIDAELLTKNPTERIEMPRVASGMPRPIRDADLALALRHADPQMRCWLLLAAFAGMRCQEIAGLDREDVLETEGAIRIVAAKGGKERIVPLHPEVLAALQALPMPTKGALFRRKRCLDRYPAYHLSQLVGAHLRQVTGLEHIGAHQLRHFFGQEVYRTNRDLLMTQKLLGHASPTTTQVYASADPTTAAPTVAGLHVGP